MLLLAALKRRRFLLLWLGQTASHLGTHIYQIALAWWVLEKTGSAAAMGGVLIAAFAPTSALVLVGGVIADRLPRIPIMLASDCARLALMIAMTALALGGSLTIWLVLVISALIGVMDAFFWPAYKSIFPELVPQSELASANSVEAISGQAVHILAPAAGAGLIAVGGIPIAFALNGGSFLLSAVSLIAMLALPRKLAEGGQAPDGLAFPEAPMSASEAMREGAVGQPGGFWRELRAGVAAARALPWILLTIALAGLANLGAEGAIAVALPYYVQHTLAGSPLLYGGLLAASAVGGVPAALWLGSRTVRRRGPLLYGALALGMLALSLVGLIPWPPVMLAAMFVAGLGVTIFDIAWTTALQQYIPLEKLGRVSSIDQLGSFVVIPLSYGLTGLVVDRIGASPDLIWSGVIAAAIVSLGFLSRSVRALE
ncbi:MAG TPA: MFS transporter [Ktedonobacterales bacterium]|nr:MFS transporter [Ktedonobacterales bacterium]